MVDKIVKEDIDLENLVDFDDPDEHHRKLLNDSINLSMHLKYDCDLTGLLSNSIDMSEE